MAVGVCIIPEGRYGVQKQINNNNDNNNNNNNTPSNYFMILYSGVAVSLNKQTHIKAEHTQKINK